MSERLQGQCALVTGAARGIGEAIARAFCAEVASVIVTDRDEHAAERLACELDCTGVRLDVAAETDWQALAARIKVLRAGQQRRCHRIRERCGGHDPEYATLDDWRAVHRVNLDGTFLGCR